MDTYPVWCYLTKKWMVLMMNHSHCTHMQEGQLMERTSVLVTLSLPFCQSCCKTINIYINQRVDDNVPTTYHRLCPTLLNYSAFLGNITFFYIMHNMEM
jgi:hypothetical protein